MVRGLDLFRDRFRGLADRYVLIGGTACALIMDEAGLRFRATQDLDAIPVTQEPSPNGGRVNMGAYGNTAEAALTVGSGFTGGESGGAVGTTPGPSGGGGGGGGCGLASVGATSWWPALWVLAIAGLGWVRRR